LDVAQLNRRQALRLLVGAGAAGLLAACADDAEPTTAPGGAGERIRIGLVAPRSGPLTSTGEELANGFRLFLEENDRKLGGMPAELVLVDEGDTVESGAAAVRKLLAERVAAITGIADSALLSGVAAEIDAAKIPVLAANGVPETLQGTSYLWSTSYAEHEPGTALGSLVAGEVARGRKVAVVAPATASGDDAVNGFRSSFGSSDARIKDTTIRTPARVAAGDARFAGPVRRIVEMDPGAVYCYYAGDAAVAFVKELREAGSQAKIYAPGGLTDGTVLSELGEYGAGVRTAVNYSADLPNDINRRFTATYRRAHGYVPSAAAVGAYDAAQVIDKALRLRPGPSPSERIHAGLAAVGQVESPRGMWQFNEARTPLQRWYLREVRRDGQVLGNVTLKELTTLG
jgi:branched-chain amino acid transport system substrate-binding protein